IYQHAGTHTEDERAFDYLRHAVKIDPGFARAWATLAFFICGDGAWFDIPLDPKIRQEARDAAARALALDPQLADGPGAMGRYQFQVEWDWGASEQELRRALELDPTNADAMTDLSDLLSSLDGRSSEAEALAMKLVNRDPLYSVNYQQLGLVYTRNGRYD